MHIATCFPRVVKLLVVLVTLALSVTVPAFEVVLMKASPTKLVEIPDLEPVHSSSSGISNPALIQSSYFKNAKETGCPRL